MITFNTVKFSVPQNNTYNSKSTEKNNINLRQASYDKTSFSGEKISFDFKSIFKDIRTQLDELEKNMGKISLVELPSDLVEKVEQLKKQMSESMEKIKQIYDGKFTGETSIVTTDKKRISTEYVNGKPTKKSQYRSDGTLEEVEDFQQGKIARRDKYDKTGTIKIGVERFVNGKPLCSFNPQISREP